MSVGISLRNGLVSSLLTQYAQTATLKTWTGTTGNRQEGNVTPTYTSTPVRLYQDDFADVERASGTISAQDRLLLVDASALAAAGIADITVRDKFEIDGEVVNVQSRRREIVAGTTIYYEVRGRAAA